MAVSDRTVLHSSLTCALASEQVFALCLVRVDGCDFNVVLRVWVQVLWNIGGLIATQDLLRQTTGTLAIDSVATARTCLYRLITVTSACHLLHGLLF